MLPPSTTARVLVTSPITVVSSNPENLDHASPAGCHPPGPAFAAFLRPLRQRGAEPGPPWSAFSFWPPASAGGQSGPGAVAGQPGTEPTRPPSTTSSWPVMYDARADSRKATASAMSSGSPSRPSATWLRKYSRTWSLPPVTPSNISVATWPGVMVLTLMPRSARSGASVRARLSTAALLAAYTDARPTPRCTSQEAFSTTEPPPSNNGSAFWTVKYAPLKLVPTTRSKSASVTSAVRAADAIPALANTPSNRPNRCRTWLTRSSRSTVQVTSVGTASTRSSASRSLVAFSSRSALRPASTTLAPSSTSRRAVARPMPLPPPVIRTVFPSNSAMSPALHPSVLHASPGLRPWSPGGAGGHQGWGQSC